MQGLWPCVILGQPPSLSIRANSYDNMKILIGLHILILLSCSYQSPVLKISYFIKEIKISAQTCLILIGCENNFDE